MPAATWRRTTSETAAVMQASKAAGSGFSPRSRAKRKSTTSWLRGRLRHGWQGGRHRRLSPHASRQVTIRRILDIIDFRPLGRPCRRCCAPGRGWPRRSSTAPGLREPGVRAGVAGPASPRRRPSETPVAAHDHQDLMAVGGIGVLGDRAAGEQFDFEAGPVLQDRVGADDLGRLPCRRAPSGPSSGRRRRARRRAPSARGRP